MPETHRDQVRFLQKATIAQALIDAQSSQTSQKPDPLYNKVLHVFNAISQPLLPQTIEGIRNELLELNELTLPMAGGNALSQVMIFLANINSEQSLEKNAQICDTLIKIIDFIDTNTYRPKALTLMALCGQTSNPHVQERLNQKWMGMAPKFAA